MYLLIPLQFLPLKITLVGHLGIWRGPKTYWCGIFLYFHWYLFSYDTFYYNKEKLISFCHTFSFFNTFIYLILKIIILIYVSVITNNNNYYSNLTSNLCALPFINSNYYKVSWYIYFFFFLPESFVFLLRFFTYNISF